MTPYILFGSDNVLSVRLDTEKLGSRWYPGAGIYRNVRLVKTNPVHIAQWGVFVTTPEINKEYATASIDLKVLNHLPESVNTDCRIEIFELDLNDQPGKKIAKAKGNVFTIKGNNSKTDTLSVRNE